MHIRDLVPFDGDDKNRSAMPYCKHCQDSRINLDVQANTSLWHLGATEIVKRHEEYTR